MPSKGSRKIGFVRNLGHLSQLPEAAVLPAGHFEELRGVVNIVLGRILADKSDTHSIAFSVRIGPYWQAASHDPPYAVLRLEIVVTTELPRHRKAYHHQPPAFNRAF